MTFNTEQLMNFLEMWNSLPSIRESHKRLWCKSNDPRFAVIVFSGKPVEFFQISDQDNHAFPIPFNTVPKTIQWSIDKVAVSDLHTELSASKRILAAQDRRWFNFKHFLEVFG